MLQSCHNVRYPLSAKGVFALTAVDMVDMRLRELVDIVDLGGHP